MQKKTPDYDNVFKTMKSKHKRLFISVINDIFGKEYPMDAKVEILPSEGYLTEDETADGSSDIKEQISDFLIRLEVKSICWNARVMTTALWQSG